MAVFAAALALAGPDLGAGPPAADPDRDHHEHGAGVRGVLRGAARRRGPDACGCSSAARWSSPRCSSSRSRPGGSSRPRSRTSRSDRRRRLPGSGLDDHRDDHRPAAVRVADPAADDPADRLLQLVGVVGALAQRGVERVDDRLLDLLEDRVVLEEAAGVDLRAAGRPCRSPSRPRRSTEMKPSSPRIRRSLSEASVMSPTDCPSTKT